MKLLTGVSSEWVEYKESPYPLRRLISKSGRLEHHLRMAQQKDAACVAKMKEMGIQLVPTRKGYGGYYEFLLQGIYQRIPDFLPSGVLMDVGAALGEYSVYAAKVHGARVYAFEPLPSSYQTLVQNVKLNGLESKISTFSAALGSKTGRMQMRLMGDMAGPIGTDPFSTEVLTIDEVGIRPDLLKIDVEGYEVEVLRGAVTTIQECHPKIIIETHSLKLREQVDQWLRARGYTSPIEERTLHDVSLWMDEVSNLYYS